MSEKQYQIQNNGQQVITDDLNLLGETAGLADDRVLSELFRVVPFNETSSSKGILPYAMASGQNNEDLVNPTVGGGQIRINPFRAIVGSRTSVHLDPKKNWQDIRSAIALGTANRFTLVSFGAASANPRWDLVYALVSVDANGPTVQRKVKDPVTKVITGKSVQTYLQTTVSIQTLAGTPSATPVVPSVPSDTGTTYYIPICYVWVPSTYSPTYTFGANSILVVAPCLSLATSTGAVSVKVADQQYTPGGPVISTSRQNGWLGAPPAGYLPPTMGGMQTLLVALDLSSATTGLHSHFDNSVIDSGDWRGRLCFWDAIIYTAANGPFPWEDGVSPTASSIAFVGNGTYGDSSGNYSRFHGDGQSIIKNFDAAITGTSLIAGIDHTLTHSACATDIALYVDHTDGGKLKLRSTSNPLARFFFKLEFTPPIGSRTHV